MKRVLAGMLAGFVVSTVLPYSRVAQARTSQAAAPAYLRATISVCAPSQYGTPCLSDYVESPLYLPPPKREDLAELVLLRSPGAAPHERPPAPRIQARAFEEDVAGVGGADGLESRRPDV